jgi:hypothetical protein
MDVNLEIVSIPVSDVDRASISTTSASAGDSTPTSRKVTTSASCK